MEQEISRRKLLLGGGIIGGVIGLAVGNETREKFKEQKTTCMRIDQEVQEIATEAFYREYEQWKRFLTDDGLPENQLRILYNPYTRETSSEYIGHGMNLSVHALDKETFDKVWRYGKSHLNSHGLMSWLIGPDNKPRDVNSASDADLDMAYALTVADKTWGGYRDDAITLISDIMKHDVEKGTFLLKGGDMWGGSNEANPSYYSPAYYEIFNQYTGDTRWDKVLTACRGIFDALEERGFVLPPNWTTIQGGRVPYRPEDDIYGYEALRVAWRQAEAAMWFCDTHALQQVKKIYSFFRHIDPLRIVDGYDAKTGSPVGNESNPAFVSAVAIASLVSEDTKHQKALLEQIATQRDDNVYVETIRLLSLLFLSDTMKR